MLVKTTKFYPYFGRKGIAMIIASHNDYWKLYLLTSDLQPSIAIVNQLPGQ